MQGSNTVSYYIFSFIETTVTLLQKICYTTDVLKPKVTTAILVNDITTPTSADISPVVETTVAPSSNRALQQPSVSGLQPTLHQSPVLPIMSPVNLEFLDESSLRKTQDVQLFVKCVEEFKFQGRFYTLNRKPLTKIYRGEDFLFRAGVEVATDVELDILETYFICVSI